MNRVTLYRSLTILSAPFSIIVFYIIVYVKPALAQQNPQMSLVFVWFTAFSLLSTMLNLRQISIMCKTKSESQQDEIFSRRGRFILRNDPGTFFSDHTLREYKMHQRLYVVFFILFFVILYFILNAHKFGITIPIP